MRTSHKMRWLLTGVATSVLLLGSPVFLADMAHAEGGKGTQTQQGPGGGKGDSGNGGQTHMQGNGSGGHEATTSSDEGDNDGRGPQYGKPSGNQGGTPSWASEGIPEVELGRLNVIRSPQHVLDRALTEVVANFDPLTMESLYEMSSATFATTVASNWDTVTLIDSPLENLALLKELWTTGTTSLPDVTPASTIELAAIFIGVASDKYMPVSEDTVEALATIVGVNLSQATIDAIAAKAEVVRIGVLTGHDGL